MKTDATIGPPKVDPKGDHKGQKVTQEVTIEMQKVHKVTHHSAATTTIKVQKVRSMNRSQPARAKAGEQKGEQKHAYLTLHFRRSWLVVLGNTDPLKQ